MIFIDPHWDQFLKPDVYWLALGIDPACPDVNSWITTLFVLHCLDSTLNEKKLHIFTIYVKCIRVGRCGKLNWILISTFKRIIDFITFPIVFHFSWWLISFHTYRVQWTQLSTGLCPKTLGEVYKLLVDNVVIVSVWVQRGQDILKWTWKQKVCRIMEHMWLDSLTLHLQGLEVPLLWLMCSDICGV